MRSVTFLGKFTSGSSISGSRSDLLTLPIVRLVRFLKTENSWASFRLTFENTWPKSFSFKNVKKSALSVLKNQFSIYSPLVLITSAIVSVAFKTRKTSLYWKSILVFAKPIWTTRSWATSQGGWWYERNLICLQLYRMGPKQGFENLCIYSCALKFG